MRKIKLSIFRSLLFFGSLLVMSISAVAVVDPGEGGIFTVKVCTISRNDTLVQVGNTCPEGTKNCAANPCGQ